MMSKASEIDEEEFQKCLKKPIVKVSNIITCRFSLDSNLTFTYNTIYNNAYIY